MDIMDTTPTALELIKHLRLGQVLSIEEIFKTY